MCINLHVISRGAEGQGGGQAGREAGRGAGRGAGTQAEGQGGDQAVGAPGKTARRRCDEMSQMPPPKNSVTCAVLMCFNAFSNPRELQLKQSLQKFSNVSIFQTSSCNFICE